jgi:dTDP-4-amino-4,6-dideoxygalactose transaminase
MLLVSEPVLGADEKAALAAVIDSGWVTMGDRWHRRLSAKPGRRERDFIT